jgi:hypothetical protein
MYVTRHLVASHFVVAVTLGRRVRVTPRVLAAALEELVVVLSRKQVKALFQCHCTWPEMKTSKSEFCGIFRCMYI